MAETAYVRLKLRTKSLEAAIQPDELALREMAFSNSEKAIYIKDLEGNLNRFIPVDDGGDIGPNTIWSSEKVNQEILNSSILEHGGLTLHVVAEPGTPADNKIFLYVTSEGTSPYKEVALKAKVPGTNEEIIFASTYI